MVAQNPRMLMIPRIRKAEIGSRKKTHLDSAVLYFVYIMQCRQRFGRRLRELAMDSTPSNRLLTRLRGFDCRLDFFGQ